MLFCSCIRCSSLCPSALSAALYCSSHSCQACCLSSDNSCPTTCMLRTNLVCNDESSVESQDAMSRGAVEMQCQKLCALLGSMTSACIRLFGLYDAVSVERDCKCIGTSSVTHSNCNQCCKLTTSVLQSYTVLQGAKLQCIARAS